MLWSFLGNLFLSRGCLICEALITQSLGSGFCSCCRHKLSPYRGDKTILLPGLHIFTEVIWSTQNNSLVGPLIKVIKKTKSLSEFKRARLTPDSNFYEALFRSSKPICWIPVPSLSNPQVTRCAAQAFQQRFGGIIVEALAFRTERQGFQKRKNRVERAQQRFCLNLTLEEWEAILHSYHPILIDDVVTTGFTAMRCKDLLGLERLDVICYAYRAKKSDSLVIPT